MPLRYILILTFHLYLDLVCGLLPWDFLTHILSYFYFPDACLDCFKKNTIKRILVLNRYLKTCHIPSKVLLCLLYISSLWQWSAISQGHVLWMPPLLEKTLVFLRHYCGIYRSVMLHVEMLVALWETSSSAAFLLQRQQLEIPSWALKTSHCLLVPVMSGLLISYQELQIPDLTYLNAACIPFIQS